MIFLSWFRKSWIIQFRLELEVYQKIPQNNEECNTEAPTRGVL